LLASPRGFSQLATSFFAYLRQGIHTHALSSLTIKLTLRFTQTSSSPRITSRALFAIRTRSATRSAAVAYWFTSRDSIATCSCPSITIQFSKINQTSLFGILRSLPIDALCLHQVAERQKIPPGMQTVISSFQLVGIGLVGLGRLELPTSPLSGVRSNHLSYRPMFALRLPCPVYLFDVHSLPMLQKSHKEESDGGSWWSWSGSNRRPPECKSGALPAELQPLCSAPRATIPDCSRAKNVIEADWTRAACDQHRQPEVHQTLSGDPKSRASSCEELNGVERLSLTSLTPKSISVTPPTFSLRKEVIQPQVLLRLPCYDFTPIMNHTLDRYPPCGSARRLLVQSTFVM
jgi:hypothetical protein